MKRNKRKECLRELNEREMESKANEFGGESAASERERNVEWNRFTFPTRTHRRTPNAHSNRIVSMCMTKLNAAYGKRVFDTPHTCLAHMCALFTIEPFDIRRVARSRRRLSPLAMHRSRAIRLQRFKMRFANPYTILHEKEVYERRQHHVIAPHHPIARSIYFFL